MLAELDLILQRLNSAAQADEVFGELKGSPSEQQAALLKKFRSLSRVTHPDRNGGLAEANTAFTKLLQFRNQAARAIEAGTYGQPAAIEVKSKRHRYVIGRFRHYQGAARCYDCTVDDVETGLFCLASAPSDNDLLQVEGQALRRLLQADRPEAAGYQAMLPNLIESFVLSETSGVQRQANVFSVKSGYVSLADIYQAYPQGIHPKDMAWMWRRLLDVLGYAHRRGVIHGGVLPPNILIGLGDVHEVVLANWQASLIDAPDHNLHISMIDSTYQDWYPSEVIGKQPASPSTDLLMSARSICYVLGGDPLTGNLPAGVPARLRGFLKSCLLPRPGQRPQDGWQLRSEFTELIEQLWGKRQYRPFVLPS